MPVRRARRGRRVWPSLLRGAAVLTAGGVLLLTGANKAVVRAAEGRIETPDRLQPASATGPSGHKPRAQVALVLGARVLADGRLSAMLADRVRTAADLYHAGRVSKVLVSGDHGRDDYDEVGAMRRELLALDVPAADVFCDHAGFDTWSSMVRARKVFGVSSAIVVTQRFHLPRAVYLADRAGLDATGYAADRRTYGKRGDVATARELFARVKAVSEAAVNRRPRFLGPPIPIDGDGRATWG